jgi:hypothetical protein
VRQPVEAVVDFAELLAGKRGLALYCDLALRVSVAPPARRARIRAIIVSPAVIVLITVISEPHRLAVIFVAALNDGIEPFPDRHAGPASGVPGSFARFWTETSEIPRTARFHRAPKPHPEERGMALS